MSVSDRPRRRWKLVRIVTLSAVAGLIVLSGPATSAVTVSFRAGQTASASSIPGPGFAAGWDRSGALRTFSGQDLFNQIDGGAELFLEFGFVKLRLQVYARGGSKLTLNAYEMEGPTSALGVYLMKMGRETPFPDVAARNSSEEVIVRLASSRPTSRRERISSRR